MALVASYYSDTSVQKDDGGGGLTPVTADGDAAKQVGDQTGSNHLTQATAGKRLLYKTGISPNGKPALLSDGVDDFLQAAIAGLTTPFIIMAIQPLAEAGRLIDGKDATMALVALGFADLWQEGGATNGPYAVIGKTTLKIVRTRWDSSAYIFVDGAEGANSNADPTVTSAGGITLGSDAAGTGNFANAYYFAILVYDSVPSGGTITAAEAALTARFVSSLAPTLSVTGPAGALADAGTDALGHIEYNAATSRSYTITNSGGATATLGSITVGAGLTKTADPSGLTIAPSASRTLTVSVDTSAEDVNFSAAISIPSDDAATPYNWTVTAEISLLYPDVPSGYRPISRGQFGVVTGGITTTWDTADGDYANCQVYFPIAVAVTAVRVTYANPNEFPITISGSVRSTYAGALHQLTFTDPVTDEQATSITVPPGGRRDSDAVALTVPKTTSGVASWLYVRTAYVLTGTPRQFYASHFGGDAPVSGGNYPRGVVFSADDLTMDDTGAFADNLVQGAYIPSPTLILGNAPTAPCLVIVGTSKAQSGGYEPYDETDGSIRSAQWGSQVAAFLSIPYLNLALAGTSTQYFLDSSALGQVSRHLMATFATDVINEHSTNDLQNSAPTEVSTLETNLQTIGDLLSASQKYYICTTTARTKRKVESITRSSTTATATLPNHGMSNGNSATISGADQTEYNGTFTVANVTADTFDFTVSGTPASATGTVSMDSNNSTQWLTVNDSQQNLTIASAAIAQFDLDVRSTPSLAGSDDYFDFALDSDSGALTGKWAANRANDSVHQNSVTTGLWADRIINEYTPTSPSATGYTITPPVSLTGAVGVASGVFTVTATGGPFALNTIIAISEPMTDGIFTVTADGSIANNGTSSATVTLQADVTSFTFTYTPATSGTKTFDYSNGSGLDNPASTTFIVSSAGPFRTFSRPRSLLRGLRTFR